MHHAAHVIVPLHIAGIDMSITTPVLWMFIASVLLIVFLLCASRKVSLVPVRPAQNIFEFTVQFVEKQIVEPCEIDVKTWTPIVLSIFLFVLFNDWIGLIPGATAGTGNINVTAALAIVIFLLSWALRIGSKGLIGFVKSLIPEGVSGPVVILLFPIELISQLFKPFSLAIRLFANMSGGHLLILSILGFTVLFQNFLASLLSVAGVVAISFFEIFVGFIQAYVFAFLAALMIGESLEESEEHH